MKNSTKVSKETEFFIQNCFSSYTLFLVSWVLWDSRSAKCYDLFTWKTAKTKTWLTLWELHTAATPQNPVWVRFFKILNLLSNLYAEPVTTIKEPLQLLLFTLFYAISPPRLISWRFITGNKTICLICQNSEGRKNCTGEKWKWDADYYISTTSDMSW